MRKLFAFIALCLCIAFQANAQNEFITTWQTTGNNEQITIPTTGSGYLYNVDWGDGNSDSNLTGNASHTYATASTYTVKITGSFPRIYFNNGSQKDKIQTIEQWGTIVWSSMERAFVGCSNLVLNATDTPDLSNVQSMNTAFSSASSLVDNGGAMNSWDVSTVTDMGAMFLFATAFNVNIGNWNTENVVTMNSMFLGATAFNQNIGGWNTGKVVNMGSIFQNAPAFNQDIGSWDTSSAEQLTFTFSGATAFDQDISGWDISSVKTTSSSMNGILNNATSFSAANYDKLLAGWANLDAGETQIPTNITLVAPPTTYCTGAYARNELDTTYGWTISGDTGLSCGSSTSFDTTWQTTGNNEQITIPTTGSGYLYNVDWGDGNSDSNLTGNASHTYATASTYTVKITGSFPRIYFNNGSQKDKIQTIEQWGTIVWSSMERAFVGCSNLVLNATDTPDLSNVQSMNTAFSSASSLVDNGGAMNSWDVSTVTDMGAMFLFATAFNVNIGNWNTENVVTMNSMFLGATAFNQNIGGWNTGKVVNMGSIFQNAPAFNQDIGSWDTSSAEQLTFTFSGATAFDQDISGWDISSVKTTSSSMNGILNNATSFSAANYDKLLAGWANLDAGETQIPTNITLVAPPTTYCTGAYARNELDTTYGWTISGDTGLSCGTNTFLGLTDNDWNTASNWSGGVVPNNTDVIISPGSTSNAVGDISVANMTIVEDAKLTVVGNLTKTGTLTINSGGSLIAQNSTAFDLTYNRTIETTNWYLVSAAVVNETIQDLISNHSFATGSGSNIGIGDYVNTTPGWTYSTLLSTGTLASGEGRSIKLTGATDFTSTGDMPLSDVSITISDGGSGGNGFNLIGNPFPSYLAVNHTSPSASNNLLRANTGILNQETIWFWDQSLNGGSGGYTQINQASALIDGIRYLAPGQGFFVESNGAGGSFTFPESMQSHQSTDVFSRSANSVPKIKLKLNTGSSEKTTDILYIEGTTMGWDNGYDSTVFGGASTSFMISTHLVSDSQGEDLAIQALPNSNYENMVISLGVYASSGTATTISVVASDLPTDLRIYLEDKSNNTFTRLDESNAEYRFTPSADLSGIGRFYLHTSYGTLSVEDPSMLDLVSVYLTTPNNIRITGIAEGNIKVGLYSILGKEILKEQVVGVSVNDITLPKLPPGIYIVKVHSAQGTLSKKLIIDRK